LGIKEQETRLTLREHDDDDDDDGGEVNAVAWIPVCNIPNEVKISSLRI